MHLMVDAVFYWLADGNPGIERDLTNSKKR